MKSIQLLQTQRELEAELEALKAKVKANKAMYREQLANDYPLDSLTEASAHRFRPKWLSGTQRTEIDPKKHSHFQHYEILTYEEAVQLYQSISFDVESTYPNIGEYWQDSLVLALVEYDHDNMEESGEDADIYEIIFVEISKAMQ